MPLVNILLFFYSLKIKVPNKIRVERINSLFFIFLVNI